MPVYSFVFQCFSYDSTTSSLRHYVNGKLVHDRILTNKDGTRFQGFVEKNGHLILGQDHDNHKGGYQESQSYAGLIADLQIWDQILSENEIQTLLHCKSISNSPFLTWNPESWTLNDKVRIETLATKEVCNYESDKKFLISDPLTYLEARKRCQSFQGAMWTSKSLGENTDGFNLAMSNTLCSQVAGEYLLWIGLSDEMQESKWVDESQTKTNFTNWRIGSPNGGTLENCAYMMKGTYAQKWGDAKCQNVHRSCTICTTKAIVELKLLGLINFK